MKVLHVTTADYGGAYVAARRLVEAERLCGVDAVLKTSKDFGCDIEDRGWTPRLLRFRFARKLEHWLKKLQRSTNPIYHTTGLLSIGAVDWINASDADIVHLHWITDGLLSVRDVARICKPLVWTLHDSWAFCGAEHHPNLGEGDRRYKEGYSKSNRLPTSRGLDLDRLIWEHKQRCWKDLHCTFIAPSSWEEQLFNESLFGRGRVCVRIPNCVPREVFCPGDRLEARRQFGLSADEKVIAFGAMNLQDKNKGADLLLGALKLLARKRQDLTLLCFGGGDSSMFGNLGFRLVSVGRVTDESRMAQVYRAADVFACPSRLESLSSVCMESIACGTPVVAFRVGGIPDIVNTPNKGCLVEPFDVGGMANGIERRIFHSAVNVTDHGYNDIVQQVVALCKQVM